MKLSLIAAIGQNNELGLNGRLLIKSSRDLKHFQSYTTGSAMIMGRKTWESIGRPLANRHSAVVTSDPARARGADSVHASLIEAIESLKHFHSVVIIGGGEIYRQSIDLVDTMVLTHIGGAFEADTFFPDIDYRQWNTTEVRSLGVENGVELTVATYQRKEK